jgi:hypothetical protein
MSLASYPDAVCSAAVLSAQVLGGVARDAGMLVIAARASNACEHRIVRDTVHDRSNVPTVHVPGTPVIWGRNTGLEPHTETGTVEPHRHRSGWLGGNF